MGPQLFRTTVVTVQTFTTKSRSRLALSILSQRNNRNDPLKLCKDHGFVGEFVFPSTTATERHVPYGEGEYRVREYLPTMCVAYSPVQVTTVLAIYTSSRKPEAPSPGF